MRQFFFTVCVLVSQVFAQTPCATIAPIPFQQNGKWGYLTESGIAIAPKFSIAMRFTSDSAIACLGEVCGRIDKAGTFLPPTWNRGSRPFPDSFSEGLAPTNEGGKWGYIDFQRRVVIPFQFMYAGPFADGMARVRLGDKFFFIDKTGKRLTPEFDGAFDFHEGLAAIEVGNKVGYIRRDGSIAIPAQHGSASGIDFSEGVAAVRVNGKVGFMDKSGKIVIQPKYDDVFPFSDGLAAVELNGDWGYINHQGELAIPLQFNIAHMFSEDLASVQTGTKWGYIDRTGKFAIPADFDSAMPFCGGVAAVARYRVIGQKAFHEDVYRGKHGFIDHRGRYVWRDPQEVTWSSGFRG